MASTNKRPSDVDLSASPQAPKLPRAERDVAASPLVQQRPSPTSTSDFSSSVKKKLAGSSRTGQACDRCKVRKIRCDAKADGCSPCRHNRMPCRTTDRITGKATTRGQVEAMEAENSWLRAHVAELQAQLKEVGIEPRPAPYHPTFTACSAPWTPSSTTTASEWGDSTNRRTSTSPLAGYTPASVRENTRPLPQYKHHSFGDNYLGVSSADSVLSNISGTSLSVFGHEIDITDYVDDKDYDNSYMSYTHVMRVALNHDQIEPVPLPPYQTLKEYCSWFLRSLHPFIMLLDKPTLMNLIWRIGHEPGFKPSPSETVCVHMVIASLNYQISVRNRQASLMEDSHRHYRYALSFFKDLWLSHTWRDVQALTLIVHHLRNFPKPGAAWIMACTTFQLAMELGYHRSSKAWAKGANMDKLEVEMRKRTFWALHCQAVNLSGKLGRPMPIRIEDIDVEFPEPMSDCLPGEDIGLDTFHKCSFQVGIQVAKFTVPLSRLYQTLYSINPSPRTYEDNLKRLEAEIGQWKEELPPELKDPAVASKDDYIFSLYLEYWYQEYHLHMYHPAMCRSEDPKCITSSLDKCLVAAKKLLYACTEMKKLRSLDNTWINIVTYVGAIFTTLFGHYQRRDKLTSADMDQLKSDMNEWVGLISESGQLLGFGDKLKDEIAQIIEQSMGNIIESIYKRTASQSLAQVALQVPSEQPSVPTTYTNGNHQPSYPNAASNTTEPATVAASAQTYATASVGAAYAFGHGTAASAPQRTASSSGQQSYSPDHDAAMAPSHAAALQAVASNSTVQPAEDPYAYNNTQAAANGHHAPYASDIPSADWHQWTRRTIMYRQQPGPQSQYLNGATTLRMMGGREGDFQDPNQGGQIAGDASVMQILASNNWPSMQFAPHHNGNGYAGQQ